MTQASALQWGRDGEAKLILFSPFACQSFPNYFGQITKGAGQASLHPIITKMIDAEVLDKMGARKEE